MHVNALFSFRQVGRPRAAMAAAALLASGWVGMVTVSSPLRADTIFEVEHARANARAGRLVNEYDAELLERWGALSGSYHDRSSRRYRERGSRSSRRSRTHDFAD